MIRLVSLLLALLVVGAIAIDATKTSADGECLTREAVLLHDIKELEFTAGLFTASRRLAAIPQLECVGGSAKGYREPLAVRCVNVGRVEAHWRCEATLDDSVKLGESTVTCEGFEGKLDPYVLRNSCGVKYTLEYTSWTSYCLGYLARIFSILVLTPLKYIGTALAVGVVGLLLLTLARRSTLQERRHRNNRISQRQQESRGRSVWNILFSRLLERSEETEHEEYEEEEHDDDEEEHESHNAWSGRLRDRSQIHSPYVSEKGSPYKAPISTGMASR